MHDPAIDLPVPRHDWALFLDIDGTIIDIAPTPREVTVPSSLAALLERLASVLGGAMALVSGRALADIDSIFAPLHLAAAGQHGCEIRLAHGKPVLAGTSTEALVGLLPQLEVFAETRPGILVENKGMTIAVHCRRAPQYQSELEDFLASLIAEQADGLETIPGHRVFEIKPRGFSKRTAVELFMRSEPFAGRVPVFIGDDRTDEDGFAAALGWAGQLSESGRLRPASRPGASQTPPGPEHFCLIS
jgi:trehalose 6-phosphate phosphatase